MNLYGIGIIAYALCSILMVLFAYTIKDAFKFYRDFNQQSWTPYEYDKEFAGAWVLFNDGQLRYVSLGSWDEDTDCDEWGIHDEGIYFYMDGYPLIVGSDLGGRTVVLVDEWVML